MAILKYTEYKISQALWLQIEDAKRTNMGTNTDQFCIIMYMNYLGLCGFNDTDILGKVYSYLKKLDNYHLRGGSLFGEDTYDIETHKNIDKLMDDLLTDYFEHNDY